MRTCSIRIYTQIADFISRHIIIIIIIIIIS